MSYDVIKLIDGTIWKVGGQALGKEVLKISSYPEGEERTTEYEVALSNHSFITVPFNSVLWALYKGVINEH